MSPLAHSLLCEVEELAVEGSKRFGSPTSICHSKEGDHIWFEAHYTSAFVLTVNDPNVVMEHETKSKQLRCIDDYYNINYN